ncbi:pyroglutamyl-peptidase 1 isoform X1 [Dermacentor andersoni]|uniref:pyroglutamyl-peptidase 1 isoform X1 n=1 Tax=Dermacentor andersoni TaxID=34620 RepID=UPI00215536E1|nr:pyroglutamyl-peptidase 1-like isoform X1 [Dermacentor andersoni]
MAADSSDSMNGVCLPEHEPTVLLTGFGLFRDYGHNSSNEVVKALAKTGIPGTRLVTKEVPVEYDTVSSVVPQLWEDIKPDLVVHCGMNATARNLVVENQAYNGSYCAADNKGATPKQGLCCGVSPQNERLRTCFDLVALTKKLKTAGCPVPVETSNDAGRFLCEFIYFTSLRISPWTVFIHVPPVDEPHSVQQLACTVSTIVLELLQQKKSMGKLSAANAKLDQSQSQEKQAIATRSSSESS